MKIAPVFSSKSFMILALIFRSLIHSWSHHADCEIWVPLPGFGPGPWQWKGQVLTIGPPRNSSFLSFLCVYTHRLFWYIYTKWKKKGGGGASLAVLWLRLLASTAGDVGSVPGGRTRSHMLCSVAKKKKATTTQQQSSVVCVAIERNIRVKLYFLTCGCLAVPATFAEETIYICTWKINQIRISIFP